MVSKSPNSSDIDKWIAAIERAASRSGIDTNIYFLSVQAAISGKMLSGRHRALCGSNLDDELDKFLDNYEEETRKRPQGWQITDPLLPTDERGKPQLAATKWAQAEALWVAGDHSQYEIGKMFGVSRRTVGRHMTLRGLVGGKTPARHASAVKLKIEAAAVSSKEAHSELEVSNAVEPGSFEEICSFLNINGGQHDSIN